MTAFEAGIEGALKGFFVSLIISGFILGFFLLQRGSDWGKEQLARARREKQKSVVATSAALCLLMLIFPPFIAHLPNTMTQNLGYGFLFSPPVGIREGEVNVALLLAQWVAVAICGSVTYWLLKDSGTTTSTLPPTPTTLYRDPPTIPAPLVAFVQSGTGEEKRLSQPPVKPQVTGASTPNEIEHRDTDARPDKLPYVAVSIPSEPEDHMYDIVGQELESGNIDRGTWTKAFAETGGDDRQTRVLYIKLRIAKLMAAEQARLEMERKQTEELQLAKLEHQARINTIRNEVRNGHVTAREAEEALGPLGRGFLKLINDRDFSEAKRQAEEVPLLLAVANEFGNTALHLTVIEQNESAVQMLLDAGANPSQPNSFGLSPLDMARDNSNARITEILQRAIEANSTLDSANSALNNPPSPQQDSKGTCSHCGRALQYGDQFCSECGTPLAAEPCPLTPEKNV